MLSLATHAPAIVLLREKVVFKGRRGGSRTVSLRSTGDFILLHSDLLRQYIDLEFRTLVLPFGFSIDKVRRPRARHACLSHTRSGSRHAGRA